MSSHLNFSKRRANYSFKHSFDIVFQKVETVFFTFLCIVLIMASRLESNFTKELSFSIVGFSAPIIKIATYPFNSTITLISDFNELVEAKEENKKLKEEIEELRSFYIKSLDIYQENRALRKILNFVKDKTTNYKVVRAIAKSSQIFNQDIFIDAGKNRNIKEGSIAIGYRGVLGRVVEVGEEKSRLMLLNDAQSHIPVVTSRARARGILVGNNDDLMEIIYLPEDHAIKEGDLVFTSGDGDTLPSGLLVGVVKEVGRKRVAVSMIEHINSSDLVTIIEY